LDEIIEALTDGKFHTIYDLVEKTKIPQKKMGMLLKFLLDYDFITVCSGYCFRVKLNPIVQNFWEKIKRLESEEQG